MLTPKELLEIVDTMHPVLDELNQWITADMVSRLMARLGRGEEFLLTGTDQWQMEVYKSAGGHLESVQQEIQRFINKSDAEVKAIFENAGIRAWEADDAFYVQHGMESVQLQQSKRMVDLLTDAYRRTNGEIHNFTRSTANASQQRFISVLDTAHFKVMSGAQSYTSAVREAVQEIAKRQTEVRYPTGHVDSIETAVLRAVRTGTAQASGNLSLQGMIERDWDLIRVSAHLGARYGDGGQNPTNHFWWQGKLYSRTGKTPGYPLFEESTGYGTGEGCCGWNCRHSFGPGDPNHNPFKDFDEEENKRIFDLSQKQRRLESQIRKDKHEVLALREAINATEDEKLKKELESDYVKAAERLTKHNVQYNKFCEENSLKRLSDRISIAKWNRSEAAKARGAADSKYNQWSKSIGINTDPKTLAKYYDMKYNNPKEYELFKGYTNAVDKGDISPLVGYDLYKKTADNISKQLVGVVTKDGVEIKSFTTHFIDRTIGQTSTSHSDMRTGTKIEDSFEAITNGAVSAPYIRKMKRGSEMIDDERQRYIGKNAIVTVSITENRLIQTNPKKG